MSKPPDQTRLLTAVGHALEWRDLNTELSAIDSRVLNRDALFSDTLFGHEKGALLHHCSRNDCECSTEASLGGLKLSSN